MRLLHITDPHLAMPPVVTLREHGLKRWLGYRSWHQRRKHRHLRTTLDCLSERARTEAADLILVTGDMAQLGTLPELEAGAEWLQSLGTPQQVMFVPGNHDLYAHDSWSALEGALGLYWPAQFPVVRNFADVQVIGLNSALPNSALSARGCLGTSQLEAVREVLAAKDDKRLRVVGLHHPPGSPGWHLGRWRKALADHRQLSRVLQGGASKLLLHGHLHRNQIADAGDSYCRMATASASGPGACYRRLDIQSTDAGYKILASGVKATAEGAIEMPLMTLELPNSGQRD